MATILPANFTFKDADGDLGTVKSLTAADITLLNTALQDIEDLKLCIEDPAPTGFIGLWGDDTVPSGWLLCNGAAVSRTTYAGLFAKIGTRYGAGDGSSTFNLPDMRDRYPIGAGDNVLGTAIAEQLPNMSGRILTSSTNAIINYPQGSIQSGGLFADDFTTNAGFGFQSYSGIVYPHSVNINARGSNSVYTDNGHVYPKSIALNFIIKT